MHTSNCVQLTEELLDNLSNKKVEITHEDQLIIDRIFNFVAFIYAKSINCSHMQADLDSILYSDHRYQGEYLEKLKDLIGFYGGSLL